MKGWRTFAVQAVVAGLGVAESLDWTSVLGDHKAGYLLVVLAVVNTVLRFVTSTPPGKSN